jgi:hypothetical protein
VPPHRQLHVRHGVPWNAAIVALVGPVVVGIWHGDNSSSAAGWLGGVFVFFALVSPGPRALSSGLSKRNSGGFAAKVGNLSGVTPLVTGGAADCLGHSNHGLRRQHGQGES